MARVLAGVRAAVTVAVAACYPQPESPSRNAPAMLAATALQPVDLISLTVAITDADHDPDGSGAALAVAMLAADAAFVDDRRPELVAPV